MDRLGLKIDSFIFCQLFSGVYWLFDVFGGLICITTLITITYGGSLHLVVTDVLLCMDYCAPTFMESRKDLCGFFLNFYRPDKNTESSWYLFQCNIWRDKWRLELIFNNYPQE